MRFVFKNNIRVIREIRVQKKSLVYRQSNAIRVRLIAIRVLNSSLPMKANYRSWVQLMIAIIATSFGLTLVGLALFLPPRGVIDPTVLTAYGETLTFVGALIGIDYHYRERPPKRSSEIKEQRAEPYSQRATPY